LDEGGYRPEIKPPQVKKKVETAEGEQNAPLPAMVSRRQLGIG
jgi:hypothetical protein